MNNIESLSREQLEALEPVLEAERDKLRRQIAEHLMLLYGSAMPRRDLVRPQRCEHTTWATPVR